MALGEMFSTLSSYRALDNWVQSMSTSVAGAGKIGFKAAKSTFLGGSISQFSTSPNKPSVRVGEQTLYSETTIDWSQGDLVDTSTPNQFAIKGEGFFLLMDDDKKFYYSRGGNFTYRDGQLRTPEGLVVVDKAMLQTLTRQAGITLPTTGNLVAGVAANTYNGASLIDSDLFTATSPWVKPAAGTGGGANMWLPFVNTALSQQSPYFEDPTPANHTSGDESYRAMSISAQTDFFIDKTNSFQTANTAAATSYLDVKTDNVGYIWVNGHQLNQNDLILPTTPVIGGALGIDPTSTDNPWGGYPTAGGWDPSTSRFNIGKYLQDGVNTIQIFATEWDGGQFLNTGGQVTLNAGTINLTSSAGTASKWTTKLIGPDLDQNFWTPGTAPWLSRTPSPPSQTYEDRMFNDEARDFLLVNFQYKDGLRFSKYGNTIYEAGSNVGTISLNEQSQNGVGRVLAGKLESSNVDFDNISSEMKLAEHMYDGLANVLETRYSLIDTIFQMLLP